MSLLEGTSRVALALHFARCGTPFGVITKLIRIEASHDDWYVPGFRVLGVRWGAWVAAGASNLNFTAL